MRRIQSISTVLIFSLLFLRFAHASPAHAPQRIIALSPSITEMLFSLDLADKIVGVSSFSDYPAQAQTLPTVGGLIDTNLETIVALEPDLVVLLSQQRLSQQKLEQLNIKTLSVDTHSLNDIKSALHTIGQRTQHQAQADSLINTLQNQHDRIRQKIAKTKNRPSVMVSIGHSLNQQQMSTIYISGQQDFYNDLITQAGGQNVYQKQTPSVPNITMEGIIQLNPDIIIDVFPEPDDHNYDLAQVRRQWQSMPYLRAVKDNQVHIIEKDYATIPGPRIIQLMLDFARIIHPEIDWNDTTP